MNDDAISRQAVLKLLYALPPEEATTKAMLIQSVKQMDATQPDQRWIPFTTRQLTEEEKEEHPEWNCILDCKLPDDGQRIFVTIRMRGHEEVQQDEFYSDDGCYLDSGYAIGAEAVAWMPLPGPWEGGQNEQFD